MAEETEIVLERFQQLRNRQNELYRKNTAEIKNAAAAGDRPLIAQLRASRAELVGNDRLIFEAELAFQESQLGQSEAEKRLGIHTREANKLVRKINNVASLIDKVTKVAGVLTRLIGALA